jgi:hypothetical protein
MGQIADSDVALKLAVLLVNPSRFYGLIHFVIKNETKFEKSREVYLLLYRGKQRGVTRGEWIRIFEEKKWLLIHHLTLWTLIPKLHNANTLGKTGPPRVNNL